MFLPTRVLYDLVEPLSSLQSGASYLSVLLRMIIENSKVLKLGEVLKFIWGKKEPNKLRVVIMPLFRL